MLLDAVMPPKVNESEWEIAGRRYLGSVYEEDGDIAFKLAGPSVVNSISLPGDPKNTSKNAVHN